MGMGTSVSTAVSERTAVVIEDYMFDASTAGELKPEESPKDFHDTWDLDGTDFTPEVSPDDEGYWDDFENIVLNGNYEELGSEEVTNGNFSNGSSNWVNVNDATFENSSVIFTNGARIYQSVASASSLIYKIVIDFSVISGDGVQILVGNGNSFVNYSVSDITNNNNQIVAYSNFIGSSLLFIYSLSTNTNATITNVSVKQVDPNDRWQLSSSGNSSSSITDKLTISIDNGDFASARQALSLSNGNTYELSFDLTSDNSSKSIAIRDDDGAAGGLTQTISLNFTGTQTKSFIFTANANSDAFFTKRQTASGTYTYSIDNVSVKEYAIKPLDV